MTYIHHMIALLKKHSPAKNTEDPPRYPPFIKGLPAATPERLLSDHDTLVKQIFQAVRATNKEYKTLYLPLMLQYASFVHLLPASEAHHHRGAGGLLRHGLEVAFWALQQCENAIYDLESNPEVRRQATLRWEFAIFTAGLCHDVGKCVSDMAVIDPAGKTEWNPFEETLYEWLIRKKIDRYHIRWRDARHGRHEKISPLVLDRVLQQKGRAYLAETGPNPLECMVSALNGSLSGGTENQVYTMINKADRASVDHDLKKQPHDGEGVGHVATPVVMSLFDAMRRLVKLKTWTVNKQGSRVWFIDGRLFLVWPTAAKDICARLDQDRVPGIPKHPDTLADILFEREAAIPYSKSPGEPLRRYWVISPDILGSKDNPARVSALELTNPSSILDPVPASIEGKILDPIAEEKLHKEQENLKQQLGQEQSRAQQLSLVPEHQSDEERVLSAETRVERTEPSPSEVEPEYDQEPSMPPEPKQAPPPLTEPDVQDLTDIFQPEFEKQRSLDLFPTSPTSQEVVEPNQAEDQEQDTKPAVPTIEERGEADVNLFSEIQSIAGEVLLALADDIAKEQRRWQYDVLLTEDDQIAIPYPEILGAYGLPAEEVLEGLKEQDWAEDNPQNPALNIMQVENFRSVKNGRHLARKAIVLNRDASETFIVLSKTTSDQIHAYQKMPPDKKENEPESPVASQDMEKPRQSKRRKRKKKGPSKTKQEQKALLLASGAKVAAEENSSEETQEDTGASLVDQVRDALNGDSLQVEWEREGNLQKAPLEKVCCALLDALPSGPSIDRVALLGVMKQLGPLTRIQNKGRDRHLVIERKTDGS